MKIEKTLWKLLHTQITTSRTWRECKIETKKERNEDKLKRLKRVTISEE